jgi:DNA (cytosine-5)-methyltransferase 1
MIPVIDLFAGPGGLGEGFAAHSSPRTRNFKIVLSIEKDSAARETLRLRSFFRQFTTGVPETYYKFLRGAISIEELYLLHPEEAAKATSESWLAELGNRDKYPLSLIDERIARALDGAKNWVLIGGPPCQAYSIVGRSRMARQREKHARDRRHFLYQEYLRIIAVHRPPVFVMENVKGILSSRVEGSLIINRILEDLKCPSEMNGSEEGLGPRKSLNYKLYAFADYGRSRSLFDEVELDPSRFIIECERHGIPQARHRLILLGVRSDIEAVPQSLPVSNNEISIWKVISNLPKLRSQLSNGHDSGEAWVRAVRRLAESDLPVAEGIEIDLWRVLRNTMRELTPSLQTGGEFVETKAIPKWQRSWFYDRRLAGICNHSTRAHIEGDLRRYFYAACFAKLHGRSPRLRDFPTSLLPMHKNALNSDEDDDIDFEDRFRVQVKDRPSTTVTAHISQDGHYFIHPDPIQCRSLTVREAARLQTFPDNYLFVGPRTQQYKQVGNAVPPLLARKLAGVVHRLLSAGHSG